MYAGSTAPASTRICPASRMASSLPVAVPGVLIWDTFRMSLMRWNSFESGLRRACFDAGRDQVDEVALVTLSSSTISSYFGLLMKLATEMCWAVGALSRALGVRSWWVTITSTSSTRFAMATFTTVTSGKPAFLILLRSTEAPIADEPVTGEHDLVDRLGPG